MTTRDPSQPPSVGMGPTPLSRLRMIAPDQHMRSVGYSMGSNKTQTETNQNKSMVWAISELIGPRLLFSHLCPYASDHLRAASSVKPTLLPSPGVTTPAPCSAALCCPRLTPSEWLRLCPSVPDSPLPGPLLGNPPQALHLDTSLCDSVPSLCTCPPSYWPWELGD